METIVIGTRGSELALKQSELVRQKLLSIEPTLKIELKIIKTEGDKNSSPIPLDVVGKGWFTKELEHELQNGDIDLAVHSLKDLPEQLPEGLSIDAYPEREDPRDALVSKNNLALFALPKGAVVGTDSLRRKIQLLDLRPDLTVRSIRGNVPTRIKKMEEEEYDAVVLAAAGLKRLGLEKRIAQYFDVKEITPAPGQGILAVEIKESNLYVKGLLLNLQHSRSRDMAEIERTFSKIVGGGCKAPVGAQVVCSGDRFTITAMLGDLMTMRIVRGEMEGSLKHGLEIAETLAKKLLQELHGKN